MVDLVPATSTPASPESPPAEPRPGPWIDLPTYNEAENVPLAGTVNKLVPGV